MIEANNCCICCGEIIPEGIQYCSSCMNENSVQKIHTPERKHILWDLIFGKEKERSRADYSK